MPITLVHVWCSSLWLCFHKAAGVALSHSQVVEWILGSRIQSHWPCRMLWPTSMLSRILATDRPAVPTTQAGGKIENSSTAREASSILRCTSITLRMYAASSAPRTPGLPGAAVELHGERLDVLGGQVRGRVGLAGALRHVATLGDGGRQPAVRGAGSHGAPGAFGVEAAEPSIVRSYFSAVAVMRSP